MGEITVKLTSHAKERMSRRFNPPLEKKDIAEALQRGKVYPLHGGYYLEHKNVGLVLRSRLNSSFNFYIPTVLNLGRNRLRTKFDTLGRPRKRPFKKVIVF